MSEEVIELSIDETNALRAKLGLKPLKIENDSRKDNDRGSGSGSEGGGGEGEELSLSINETNSLRAKLGLAPLRTNDDNKEENIGRKASEAIHAPAPNMAAAKEAKERIEEAKMKRELERNIRKMEKETSQDDGEAENAQSWADKMRRKKEDKSEKKKEGNNKMKKRKRKGEATQNYRTSIPEDGEEEDGSGDYNSGDLEGMAVVHDESDFQEGQTTILTLADTPLLEVSSEVTGKAVGLSGGEITLENVNMRDDGVSRDNLRKKRKLEMGSGHAGGYAGYDDDEFVELGGSSMASNRNRQEGGGGEGQSEGPRGKVGFRIGEDVENKPSEKNADQSDLFASSEGRAISLVPNSDATTNIASDFLTVEEENMEEEKRKEQKRQKKLFKKAKKDKKKKDKKSRYKKKDYGDDDDSDKDNNGKKDDGGNILDDLEATAVDISKIKSKQKLRKRNRGRDDDDHDEAKEKESKTKLEEGASGSSEKANDPNMEEGEATKGETTKTAKDQDDDEDMLQKRKAKFDEIMEKGNARTDAVFGSSSLERKNDAASTKQQNNSAETEKGHDDEGMADDEQDDAFLNAALAKARRLRRLRELNTAATGAATKILSAENSSKRGADAIAHSVKMANLAASKLSNNNAVEFVGNDNDGHSANKGLTFEFDETREFTRALRAKAEQAERPSKKPRKGISITTVNQNKGEGTKTGSGAEDEDMEDIEDMKELAQQIKEDEDEDYNNTAVNSRGFGSTAEVEPVGRGVSGVLNLLRHTGEITRKHAGKEELRGRAKDKRTYEDYESLNLKEVVKIDNKNAQEKDVEFANREIKLEYRDDFGRLLTRKEAYRQLCYQFHGYGSSKKNEERRLRQIAREHVEGTLASRQVGGSGESEGGKGTLGALKMAQRASGKAFVVHRT